MTDSPTKPVAPLREAVAEIEARASAATEGPWTWEPVDEFEGEASNAGGFSYQHIGAGHKGVADTYHASGMQCPDGGVIEPRNGNKDDANFIAHARTDIPALCQTVRAAWARIEKLNTLGEEMLTRLEVVAGIGKKADHGWYFVVEEIERQHAALREQLAQQQQRAVTSEALVREWANFHPDIPLTKTYADLVRRITALRGCAHCPCVCVDCAPCGDEQP